MNNNTTNILFIDSLVDNYEFLIEGVVGDIQKILLDSKRDGIEQITELLTKRSGVETVHIVSHGSPGCLYLGNSELSLGNLKYYRQQLDNWGCENLLLYGCNVSAGDAGEEFVEKLHRLTGANIAASKTKTGNAELGGNWELEVRKGNINSSLPFSLNAIANYSSVLDPRFQQQRGENNPLNDVYALGEVATSFVDIDNDGDQDLVVLPTGTKSTFYLNTGDSTNPIFVKQEDTNNPFSQVYSGASLSFADLDGDGDLDFISGEYEGTIQYYLNNGTINNPIFIKQTDNKNPFKTIDVGTWSQPYFTDLDNDGDQDIVVGSFQGTVNYFQNTGSKTNPVFIKPTDTSYPFKDLDVGVTSIPRFADFDGDGDQDAVITTMDWNHELRYYRNTGTPEDPLFIEQTASENPFTSINQLGFLMLTNPSFVDLNGDGRKDVVVSSSQNLLYFTSEPENNSPEIIVSQENLNYTENALQIIDAEATVTDIDSPNFNNGTLTVRFTSGSTENDRLSIRNQGTEATQINLEDTIIKYGDVEIGTFSGGVITEELVVNLNENATPTAVQELLRNITYQNVSDNPDTTERNLEFIVTDGQGGISEAVSKTISITPVNDAPIIDKVLLRVDENAKKGTVVGTLTATDPEGTTDFSDWKIESSSTFDLDGDGESAFAINANTGEITVNDSDDLNYENKSYSDVEVSVSDGQDTSKFSSIRIKVDDVKGTNVEGTSENDKLYGTPEAEIILGKEGNDNIYGMGGGDTLNGGEGIDTIRETVDGDLELDDRRLIIENYNSISTEINQLESIESAVLKGGDRRNRIDASEFSGNVYLSGGGDRDTLYAGRGNDNLSGGTENDTLDGGEGIDRVRESADADFRFSSSSSGKYDGYLKGYAVNKEEQLGSDRLYSIERLALTGGESDNKINVGEFNGNANLSGKGGNDLLTGGYGNDTLIGGEGSDTLRGGNGVDTVRESADADFRFSRTGEYSGSLESYAADGGEKLASDRLEDVEKIHLTGGESNNKINADRVWADVNLKGLGGDDTLIGGYGADTLSGGYGADSLDGGYGFDIVREKQDVSFQIKDSQLISCCAFKLYIRTGRDAHPTRIRQF